MGCIGDGTAGQVRVPQKHSLAGQPVSVKPEAPALQHSLDVNFEGVQQSGQHQGASGNKGKEVKTTTSNKIVKQKKIVRVGLDGTAGQGFENGSGNPSNSLDYEQGPGEKYHTLVTTSPAKANATKKKGASNDPNASVMAKRAEKLQANPAKVTTVDPHVNKGLAKSLAQGNLGGNPKLRMGNSFGIATKDSKK